MLAGMSGRVPFLVVRRIQHEPMLSSDECILLYYVAPPSSCSQLEVCAALSALLPVNHDGIHKPWCSCSAKINVLSHPRDTTFLLRTIACFVESWSDAGTGKIPTVTEGKA